ncbi:hypothetical protein WMY93_005754 [Mugilogobius chulae]|uniref:Uncharacterized protein n=1 Tax=Mugilogobius chulae TaxID=88201 RepID=A0AAW0PRR5_9GOBI
MGNTVKDIERAASSHSDSISLLEQQSTPVLQQRPRPSEPPRPFILRLHYYHMREDILRKAATMKSMRFQDKEIRIFPDYAPSVAKRRAQFNKARELLRGKPGVRYGLLYPARLIVTHDGVQTSFTDPLKAEEYAVRLFKSTSEPGPSDADI